MTPKREFLPPHETASPFRVAEDRRERLTTEEAASLIERFRAGHVEPWEWDDFISIPSSDPRVEAARLRCRVLPEEHPPTTSGEYCDVAGLAMLDRIARTLRQQ